MPTKVEAWDAIGHVYWKKGDLKLAKESFEHSLELDDKNKEILCKLSMVIRQVAETDPEKRKENYNQSIKLANKACGMDLKDSQSWYTLGNAHLTNFFNNNESTEQLELALKAYSQTEKWMKVANPDLFYNRGTVLEYLERYNEAMINYSAAANIDPNMDAEAKANRIISFVGQTSQMILKQNDRKNANITAMVKTIPSKISGEIKFPSLKESGNTTANYEIKGFAELNNGNNQGKMISSKVVMHLAKEQQVPNCFLLVDHQYNFAVMSLYNTNSAITEKVKAGDHIYIKNPQYIFTSIDHKGKRFSYNSLKIDWLADVLVNSQPLVEQQSQSTCSSEKLA